MCTWPVVNLEDEFGWEGGGGVLVKKAWFTSCLSHFIHSFFIYTY